MAQKQQEMVIQAHRSGLSTIAIAELFELGFDEVEKILGGKPDESEK